MAKTLYLIRAESNDGGRSNQIATEMISAGLTFTSKTFGVDPLSWHQLPTVPCVVIDTDGKQYKTFDDRPEAPINISTVTTEWTAAPSSIPSQNMLSEKDVELNSIQGLVNGPPGSLTEVQKTRLMQLIVKALYGV